MARRKADQVEAVSVVIPTLNGARFLPTCLDALRRQSRRADEVIVVDDGSVDETAALVASNYSEVRLVRHPRPRGVAAGFNSGIRASVHPIVVLLNNDTEAEPNWLDAITSPLVADASLQLVAAKLLLFDRRQVIHSAGDFYGRDGLPGSRGVWETDRGQYDGQTETFGPCAAAAAYRRSTLDALGLFDESLGSYCEDVDLNFRARLAGYRCQFVPSARVYHRLSATGGGALSSYFVGRNTLWILAQNMPAALLERYWPRVVARQVAVAEQALRHWREPAARARLRGQLCGVRGLRERLARRQAIQDSRRVSIAALDALLT